MCVANYSEQKKKEKKSITSIKSNEISIADPIKINRALWTFHSPTVVEWLTRIYISDEDKKDTWGQKLLRKKFKV